jgi:hypothetical protein
MKGARSSIGVLVDIGRNINCRLDITADVVILGRRKIIKNYFSASERDYLVFAGWTLRSPSRIIASIPEMISLGDKYLLVAVSSTLFPIVVGANSPVHSESILF